MTSTQRLLVSRHLLEKQAASPAQAVGAAVKKPLGNFFSRWMQPGNWQSMLGAGRRNFSLMARQHPWLAAAGAAGMGMAGGMRLGQRYGVNQGYNQGSNEMQNAMTQSYQNAPFWRRALGQTSIFGNY